MATYPVRTRRWTRAEYDRLIDIELLAVPGARILVSDLLP
jgi:hypothetical protein